MLQAQIYINKDDLMDIKPLYEYILDFLLAHEILRATAFYGKLGYGKNRQMSRPDDLFSFDGIPIMIIFMDEEEKVKTTLKELRKEVKTGLIITTHVEIWN